MNPRRHTMTQSASQPSEPDEPREIIIKPEQWSRLSDEERAAFKEKLEAALGGPVVIRIGDPPSGSLRFGADGSIDRT
jgi:uncharacterized membrane protein